MKKSALLIGVSEYGDGFNPFPEAVNNIKAIQGILLDSSIGGFDQVSLLANPDPQTMEYEIEILFSDLARDDLALIFFSGYGIKDDSGRLYFATRITRKNGKGALIRSTAVPARFVSDVMGHSRCKQQVIILDWCLSSVFDEGLVAKDDGSVDIYSQLGGMNIVVLTSSSSIGSTQYELDDKVLGLSLYTQFLIEGIQTNAVKRNEDAMLSPNELHTYVSQKVIEIVPKATPEIYVNRGGFNIQMAKVY